MVSIIRFTLTCEQSLSIGANELRVDRGRARPSVSFLFIYSVFNSGIQTYERWKICGKRRLYVPFYGSVFKEWYE